MEKCISKCITIRIVVVVDNSTSSCKYVIKNTSMQEKRRIEEMQMQLKMKELELEQFKNCFALIYQNV
jgi:hypothetical protein